MVSYSKETSVFSSGLVMSLKNNLSKINAFSYVVLNSDEFLEGLKNISKKAEQRAIDFNVNHRQVTENEIYSLYKFNLSKKSAITGKIIEGEFLLLYNKKLKSVVVMTENSKKYLKEVISKFNYLMFYPHLSKITLTSSNLYEILSDTEKVLGKKIYSNRSSGKRLFGEEETILKFEKGNLYPFKKVFDLSLKDNVWVHWISLISIDKDNVFRGDISRDGSVSLYAYDSSILNTIFDNIVKIGLQKKNMFTGKEMTPETGPKPFLLQYKEKVFSDVKNVIQLRDSLLNIKDFSFSVIHGGNPHLYMYLKDTKTDSSYSLKTLGEDKILITPQYTSSSVSLNKLIDYLVDNFSEYGEIKEVV